MLGYQGLCYKKLFCLFLLALDGLKANNANLSCAELLGGLASCKYWGALSVDGFVTVWFRRCRYHLGLEYHKHD